MHAQHIESDSETYSHYCAMHEKLTYTILIIVSLWSTPHCNFHHLILTCMCFVFLQCLFFCLTVTLYCLCLACNVLYINSVDMESLTGPQAIAKAISQTLATNPLPDATTVHFKVSTQGITLTDSQRKWVHTYLQCTFRQLMCHVSQRSPIFKMTLKSIIK